LFPTVEEKRTGRRREERWSEISAGQENANRLGVTKRYDARLKSRFDRDEKKVSMIASVHQESRKKTEEGDQRLASRLDIGKTKM